MSHQQTSISRRGQRPARPDQALTRAAWSLEKQTAVLAVLALRTLNDQLDGTPIIAGSGTTDSPHVSGSTRTIHVPADAHGPAEDVPVTAVEAAVMRSEGVRDRRAELHNRKARLVAAIDDYNRWLRTLINPDELRTIPELCGQLGRVRGYDGYDQGWKPHDRDPRNGWHDPLCHDIAGPHGLCDRCLPRMNRWRLAHGLTAIGVQTGGEVVTTETAA